MAQIRPPAVVPLNRLAPALFPAPPVAPTILALLLAPVAALTPVTNHPAQAAVLIPAVVAISQLVLLPPVDRLEMEVVKLMHHKNQR